MKKLFIQHNFSPKKKLGQNFLIDKQVIKNIIQILPIKKDITFIEIGPGFGALTSIFIQKKKLLAIEIDKILFKYLKNNIIKTNNLILYRQDILNFDFTKFYNQQVKKRKLCIFGNLPYNIVSKLFFHIFNHISVIDSMYFMVQKELSERILSYHNNKTYGRLTVTMQYFCKSYYLFNINSSSFYPKPIINSVFIKIKPKICENNLYDNKFKNMFMYVVSKAFKKRRKILSNSLNFINNIKQILTDLNINPNLRPENLSYNNYYQICKYLYVNQIDICS